MRSTDRPPTAAPRAGQLTAETDQTRGPMTEQTEFEQAAERVAAGADAGAEAAALVALMTDDERRWCLDGDRPFWAGLADHGPGRLPPAHRSRPPGSSASGVPGLRVLATVPAAW